MTPTPITYADDHGDAITEHPPMRLGGCQVVVSVNPTGFRLVPAGCQRPGCDQPATIHVVRHHPSGGKSQTYTCDGHVDHDVATAAGWSQDRED